VTGTTQVVAYLAASEELARKVEKALEAEGITCSLVPATDYHRLEGGRIEVRVGGELASRARVLAIAAAGGDGAGKAGS
jgi:hypothetical protein